MDSRKREVVFVVVVAVVGLLALLIGRATAPDPDSGAEGRGAETETRRVVNGVPVGYSNTEGGAIEAATNFARVMASATGDDDAYREAWRTMAAPEWQERAEELAQNGLDFLNERYGGEGSFSFAPIRYRVLAYEEAAATVEIWGVTVASGPKIQGIEESWLTASINLAWVSGDWRVAGQDSRTGPTPELLTSQDADTPGALDEFEEYEHAPAP